MAYMAKLQKPEVIRLLGVDLIADITKRKKKPGSPWVFIIPIVVLIVVMMICDQDVVSGIIAAVVSQGVLYLATRTMNLTKYMNCVLEGVSSMAGLAFCIFFGYVLGESNTALGFSEFVVNGLSSFMSPVILPAFVFIIVAAGNDIVTFYCGICLIGISFGSFMGVFPAFTSDQFGPKNNSVNYGIMFIGFAVAGYLGPTIMRSTLDNTGGYTMSFIIAAFLAFAGLGAMLLFKRINRCRQA